MVTAVDVPCINDPSQIWVLSVMAASTLHLSRRHMALKLVIIATQAMIRATRPVVRMSTRTAGLMVCLNSSPAALKIVDSMRCLSSFLMFRRTVDTRACP